MAQQPEVLLAIGAGPGISPRIPEQGTGEAVAVPGLNGRGDVCGLTPFADGSRTAGRIAELGCPDREISVPVRGHDRMQPAGIRDHLTADPGAVGAGVRVPRRAVEVAAA